MVFSVMLLTAAVFAGTLPADAWTWEELVEAYGQKEELKPEAKALGENLLAEASDLQGVELWRHLVDPDTPGRQRAADGLKLIKELFPGGEPSRWDDVSGFWLPAMVPKLLAAFDAVYYTVMGLLKLDKPEAAWLARQLLTELKRSSRATHLALREAPAEYETILSQLEKTIKLPPVGGWPKGKTTGTLPFARPVRFHVSADYALMKGMIFLNSSGVPVSGMGSFAWDRKRGDIYHVLDEEFLFWRWER
ncbi:MAG: cell division protein FtsL [Thermovirgaceae bacterium]